MHPTPRLAAALLAGSGLGWPLLAQADLVEDSHASLELRNFYFNRDFRQSGARDNADEWAQGFLLRLESGFSEGTVGFGVDAIGLPRLQARLRRRQRRNRAAAGRRLRRRLPG